MIIYKQNNINIYWIILQALVNMMKHARLVIKDTRFYIMSYFLFSIILHLPFKNEPGKPR